MQTKQPAATIHNSIHKDKDPEALTGKEKEKEKEKGNSPEGAQVWKHPHPNLGQHHITGENRKEAMLQNQAAAPMCQFMGPQKNIHSWEQLGADKVLLEAIRKGIKAPLHQIPGPSKNKKLQCTTPQHLEQLTRTIGEYCQTGAIRKLTSDEQARTKTWVPIFPRLKKDSGKIRIITDLRELNQCHGTPKHKPDNWKTVLNKINNRKLQWAIKLDLKGYYHHLKLHPNTQRWMRIQINNQGYQLIAMPFGWSLSPFWANKLAKPIKRWLNQKGIHHI